MRSVHANEMQMRWRRGRGLQGSRACMSGASRSRWGSAKVATGGGGGAGPGPAPLPKLGAGVATGAGPPAGVGVAKEAAGRAGGEEKLVN